MTEILKKLDGLKKADPSFDGAQDVSEIHANSIHIIGFEFDGTACFRKGTVKGPNALREVSSDIETYSPYLNKDTTEIPPYVDLGNLPVGTGDNIEKNWQQASDYFFDMVSGVNLKEKKVKFFTLGGEHSISYAPIRIHLEQYPDLVLLHLDAHADLRDGYQGYKFSHASIIRRALDHFGSKHELIQYGIRSGTQEEYEWMKENKTVKTSRDEFLTAVQNIDDKRPVYLTLDLDYFDPSFFPGTGTPEPGGEDFHSFIKLMKILKTKNFVGVDVTELSPDIDPTGNSSVFAAKVVRELLLCLSC